MDTILQLLRDPALEGIGAIISILSFIIGFSLDRFETPREISNKYMQLVRRYGWIAISLPASFSVFVITYMELWIGDWSFTSWLYYFLASTVILSILTYLRISKLTKESEFSDRAVIIEQRYSELSGITKFITYAFVIALAISLSSLLLHRDYQSNKTIIIVADFGNNDEFDPDSWIYLKLDTSEELASVSNTELLHLPQLQISSNDEAKNIGNRFQASIIIWGYQDDAGTQAILTITDKTDQPYFIKPTLEPIPSFPLGNYSFHISTLLPTDMEYIVLISTAQILANEGRYLDAISLYDAALSLDIDGREIDLAVPYINMLKSIAYSSLRNYEVAIESIEIALKWQPKTPEFILWRAMMLRRNSNPNLALDDLNILIDGLDQEVRESQAWILRQAHVVRAQVLSELGDLGGAETDLDSALKLAKTDEERATVFSIFSYVYIDHEFIDLASEYAVKAISMNSSEINAHIALVRISEGINNLEIAEEAYKDAIKASDRHYMVLQSRALFYRLNRMYELALSDIDEAIAKNPDYCSNYYERGIILDELGRYYEALDDLNTTLRICPNEGIPLEVRSGIKTHIAISDDVISNYYAAIDDCMHARSLGWDPLNCYLHITLSYFGLGNAERAKLELELAVKKYPDSETVWFAKGFLHYADDEYESAVNAFERSLEILPTEDYFTNLLLSLSYYGMGDEQSALEYCKRVFPSITSWDECVANNLWH